MKFLSLPSITAALSLIAPLAFGATAGKKTPAAAATKASSTAKKEIGQLSETEGSTEFLALGHPSALKVVGKGASPRGELTVEPGNLHGKATFNLQSLDTGIETRTEHMKNKYLEVGKYPQSTLEIAKLALPANAVTEDFSESAAPFEGTLTLHGVEKPVTGSADLKRAGNQLNLVVHFGLKISDYGIEKPGYAGITLADEVQVTVKDSATLASAER